MSNRKQPLSMFTVNVGRKQYKNLCDAAPAFGSTPKKLTDMAVKVLIALLQQNAAGPEAPGRQKPQGEVHLKGMHFVKSLGEYHVRLQIMPYSPKIDFGGFKDHGHAANTLRLVRALVPALSAAIFDELMAMTPDDPTPDDPPESDIPDFLK